MLSRLPRPRNPIAALALTLAVTGVGLTASAVPASAAQLDYATGLALGQQAFEYGLPVLDTDRVFRTATSLAVADTAGNGPVNQFNHFPELVVPSPGQRTVVTPNADTLYSIAWLDLTREPQILHVPEVADRFYGLQLLTPWTENLYNITSASGPASTGAYRFTSGGDFAVVPPGFRGTLPAGVKRVVSPYSRVWVIGRTLIRGESDTAAVNAIQQKYTVTPLSRYGTPFVPPAVDPAGEPTFATVPGTRPGEDRLDFYAALNRQLERFPAPAADRPLLERLAAIGVGAGLDPGHGLGPEALQGMRDAVAQGPAALVAATQELERESGRSHNGHLVVRTGTYGTDYRLRAIVDLIGLGALVPNVAVYPIAMNDVLRTPLTGGNRYVLHIPASKLPPVEAFWSLTMYDGQGFFVPNPLDRFLINDRSDLRRNRDGSIDIYVQSTRPGHARQVANWLPAPAGNFRLVWRLYSPSPTALEGILSGTGWKPPRVQRCVGVGIGIPDLTPCAR